MANNIGYSSIFPSTGFASAGSVGPTGSTGPTQTIPGPTGPIGVDSTYITQVNVDSSGQVEFTLSDGTVVSPGIFKGVTGIYAGLTATSIGSGIPVLKGVCGGITLEFYNFRTGGVLGVSYSSADNLKFTILEQNTGGGISASTQNNRIVYFKQRNYIMSTDLSPERATSANRVGDTDYGYINFGNESGGRNVVADIRDTLLTIGPIERGERIVSTDTFFDQGSTEGITLDISRATVYQLITPIGIKAFKYDPIPDGQVMSVTLFVDGEDVWNFPSDVVFDEESKPIFFPGMNILHMWKTNEDDNWRAHFTARGFGINQAINPGLKGSCCYFDVDDEKHCEDYVTQTYCDEREGTFEAMVPCTKNKCIVDTNQKTYDGVCCSEGRCISEIDPNFCQAINGQFISGITCGEIGLFPDNNADNFTTYNLDGSVNVLSGLCYNYCKDTSVYCCKDGECLGQLTEEYCKYLGGKTIKNVNSCIEAKCCDLINAPGSCCIPDENGYRCQDVQTPYECNTTLNGIYMGKNTNCESTRCDCNSVLKTCYKCSSLPVDGQCNCQQVSVNLQPGDTCENYNSFDNAFYFTTESQCNDFCEPVDCYRCSSSNCVDKQLCGQCTTNSSAFQTGTCDDSPCATKKCYKSCNQTTCQCPFISVLADQECPQTYPNDSCDCLPDCGEIENEQTVACFWCFAHIQNGTINDSDNFLLSPIVLQPNDGMMGGFIKYQGLYDGRFYDPSLENSPKQWQRIQPDVPNVDNLSILNRTQDDIDNNIFTLGQYLEFNGYKTIAQIVADQAAWKKRFIKQSQAPYRAVAIIDESTKDKLDNKTIDDVSIQTKTGLKTIQLDSQNDLYTPIQIPYFIEEWPDNVFDSEYPVDTLRCDRNTEADVIGVRGKFKCYYVGSYTKTNDLAVTRKRCLTRFGYTPEQQIDCKLCDPIQSVALSVPPNSPPIPPDSPIPTGADTIEPYQDEIQSGILAPFPPLWGRITYKFDLKTCQTTRVARTTHNLRLLNYKTITDMCLATFNGELKYFIDLLHTDYTQIDLPFNDPNGRRKVIDIMVRGIKESMGVPETINFNPPAQQIEFTLTNPYYNRLLGNYVFEDQTPEISWTEWIDSPLFGKKLFGAGCVAEGYVQYDPYMLCNVKSYKGKGIEWSYFLATDQCPSSTKCKDLWFNNNVDAFIPNDTPSLNYAIASRFSSFTNLYRLGMYGDKINILCADEYLPQCTTFDNEDTDGYSSFTSSVFYPHKQELLHGSSRNTSTGEMWFEVPSASPGAVCTGEVIFNDATGEIKTVIPDPIRDRIGYVNDNVIFTEGQPWYDVYQLVIRPSFGTYELCATNNDGSDNGRFENLRNGIPRGILGRNLRYNLDSYRTYTVFYNRPNTTQLNGPNQKSLSEAQNTAVPIVFVQGSHWVTSCGTYSCCENGFCCCDGSGCFDPCASPGADCGGGTTPSPGGGSDGESGPSVNSCSGGPQDVPTVQYFLVAPSTVTQTQPLIKIKTGDNTKLVKIDEGLCVHMICPTCELYESC